MGIYLDNAATTPMSPEVIEAMTKVMKEEFGNPSSIHAFGRSAKATIENARRSIANIINAEPKEIIFTSGGTEADNMAIMCAVKDLNVTRIITSSIEHHAVVHSVDNIKKQHNVNVELVKLNEFGQVDLNDLERLLTESTEKTLVSLMHANNEIGTLLDLNNVGELCHSNNALFHSDTVQTMAHYKFDLRQTPVDFITCAAHKFHGPKGAGFLYFNKDLKISPFIEGGAQERGLRGGTENVTGIIGLAKALEEADAHIEKHANEIFDLKNYMYSSLQSKINQINLNGLLEKDKSLYTVLNVLLPNFKKQDMLLFMLDLEGIACSGGSACTAGANTGSHVLRGIGADTTRPNIRFSFSKYTTKQDIDTAIEKLVKIINS